jgi:16S rRNA (cytosine967-C5)-methyltransferase
VAFFREINKAMHPNQLVDETALLISQLLRFEYPADGVVSRHLRAQRSLGPRDRATLADAVFAVLRYKPRYEYFAQSGVGPPMRRLALLGLAQSTAQATVATSLFMDSATQPDERSWLAQCAAQNIDTLPMPLQHCLPTWLANALHDQYGNTMLNLAKSLLQPAPLDVRVNALKAKRDGADGVLSSLHARDIKGAATPYSPLGIRLEGKPNIQTWPEFESGAMEIQDEGSQLLALLMQAKRGEMVADFCAGAGGKTLALGAQMRNTGRLYAFDISAKRLDKLKPRLARSGLSNVHPVAIAHERDVRVKRLAGKMDRVLVDAPCSGLGTLRRSPDLKWRQTPQSILEMHEKQSAILQAASTLVKPGGRLVYATCSLLQSENLDIATVFAANNAGFQAVDLNAWAQDYGLQSAVPNDAALPHLALRPDIHQTDGFFAVVFQRA